MFLTGMLLFLIYYKLPCAGSRCDDTQKSLKVSGKFLMFIECLSQINLVTGDIGMSSSDISQSKMDTEYTYKNSNKYNKTIINSKNISICVLKYFY